VNIHKNARLTPRSREQLVQRVQAGEPPEEVAHGFGISVRTVHKWLKRWRVEGKRGLLDRSSRPHRSPRRLSRQRERHVLRLRERRWTGARIADYTGIALSTVGAVLRRHSLGRLEDLEPTPPVIRYEWDRPGELVHLDIKKLARIERIGHRIHGDRQRQKEGAGWEYLHVCVDDASRVAYAEVLPDEKGRTCADFLLRAAAWFGQRSVQFERVMTDNGSGYVSHVFQRAIEHLRAKHIRTRPYTPKTNGKAERFIQTCKREWAYAEPYSHSRRRTAALRRFLNYYNCHRPHWGIGRKTPQLRLTELVNNVSGCNI